MSTRRQWLLQVGSGAVLAGWTDVDLAAAELPPGVFEASREHLGHALAGQPMAVDGETELVQIRGSAFQPAFLSRDEFQTLVRLTALMLGEPPDTAVVREIAEWIDLTASEAAAIRTAARSLSPAHRAVAVAYYSAEPVRTLETFDAQKTMRDGLAWLDAESRRRHGTAFAALSEEAQRDLLESIADRQPAPGVDAAGTRFFIYLKGRVINGFYTSRAGLNELGYRGNAYYASPPGCEHLYG